MNKLTRYAHIVESHGTTYLFNVANGRVIAMDSSLSSIIEN